MRPRGTDLGKDVFQKRRCDAGSGWRTWADGLAAGQGIGACGLCCCRGSGERWEGPAAGNLPLLPSAAADACAAAAKTFRCWGGLPSLVRDRTVKGTFASLSPAGNSRIVGFTSLLTLASRASPTGPACSSCCFLQRYTNAVVGSPPRSPEVVGYRNQTYGYFPSFIVQAAV